MLVAPFIFDTNEYNKSDYFRNGLCYFARLKSSLFSAVIFSQAY